MGMRISAGRSVMPRLKKGTSVMLGMTLSCGMAYRQAVPAVSKSQVPARRAMLRDRDIG